MTLPRERMTMMTSDNAQRTILAASAICNYERRPLLELEADSLTDRCRQPLAVDALGASVNVEVIHGKKSARIFHFELRPAVQVGSREFARVSLRVPLLHL